MMGEHRMVAKGVPYEGAVRVPLLLRLPGVAPRRVPAAVSQVDVVPTLLDALGVTPPDHLHGASLLPQLRDEAGVTPPGEVVIEWNGARTLPAPAVQAGGDGDGDEEDTEGASLRTIRRGRWKLTVDEDGEHELYDLRDDPCETRNLLFSARLGETPGALGALDDLWARLRAWQARTRDPLDLPAPAPWGE
jgi:arylsulfatase A-like enzyme